MLVKRYACCREESYYSHVFVEIICRQLINSLPYGKILDPSKLKAFAYYKLKLIKMAKIVLNTIENIVGKEENAGYHYFLLFPQCFQ